MTGPSLRDQGHAQVLEHSSEWWASCCRQALDQLAASGTVFTIDTLRDCGVPEPHSPNAWGAVVMQAARRDQIRRVGAVPAHRPESRGRWVAQWQGVAA